MQFVNQYNISSASAPSSPQTTIKYESISQFIKTLPTDIEKFSENDIKNIILKLYQCTSPSTTASGISSCGSIDNLRSSRKGLSTSTSSTRSMLQQQQQQQQQNNNNGASEECKARIELLYKYLLPLNQKYPNLVSNELIQQVLSHYLPFVLPKKVVLDNGEDISRYWGLYIVYNVNNFVPTLTNHLRQLYKSTITTPNFEQYQHMIKYYKAVSPTLNNEMYKFKDYYSEMINNYYLNAASSGSNSLDSTNDSTQMMLEVWYSYLCLCGDQNQNQLEFSRFLTEQLKGEQLLDFICKFNKNYFDNKTLNMTAFTNLVESLFTIDENKRYILSTNLNQSQANILLDLCKSNPRLNIYLNNFN